MLREAYTLAEEVRLLPLVPIDYVVAVVLAAHICAGQRPAPAAAPAEDNAR